MNTLSLVTGANKSIGLEIARQLAACGHTVLLGARDPSLGKKAAERLAAEGLDVHFIHIDLHDDAVIARAVDILATTFGYLDVLINNAAVVDAEDGAADATNLAAFRRTFETNVFGTLSVTQMMLPLLRKSRAARIVNLSSALGSLSLAGDPESEFHAVRLAGYAASKAALNMITVQLAAELKNDGIVVNAVDPGFTATDMNGHQGYQTVAEGAAEAIRLAITTDRRSGDFSATGRQLPW